VEVGAVDAAQGDGWPLGEPPVEVAAEVAAVGVAEGAEYPQVVAVVGAACGPWDDVVELGVAVFQLLAAGQATAAVTFVYQAADQPMDRFSFAYPDSGPAFIVGTVSSE